MADPPPHLPARRTTRNLHVRGYKEEGTTTTPFDMVMLNDLDRFHLVIDVIDRVPGPRATRRRACGRRWSTERLARAPGRASTARTTRRSATGPGRTEPDASSSSTRARRASSSHLVDGTTSRRRSTTSSTADAVGHRVVHGGERFVRPVADRRRGRCARSRSLRSSRRCTTGRRSRRSARRGQRCRTSRTWPSSTRPSTRTIPEEAATYAVPDALARGVGDPPLRLPRARGRSGSPRSVRVPRGSSSATSAAAAR